MNHKLLKGALIIGSGAALAAVLSVSVAFASTPACPSFTRSLYFGRTGSDVTALQEYLYAGGYLRVSPTGYFGPLTESAVAHWQADGGVVAIGGSGSGIFGPLSRAHFVRTCGNNGTGSGNGSTNSSTTFSANPLSGAAPLTVQFTDVTLQGGTMGSVVNFGDGTSGNLALAPTYSAASSIGIVSHTYTTPGTYTATLMNNPCAGSPEGTPCTKMAMLLGSVTITVTNGTSTSTNPNIVQVNAPADVTLSTGGIAEVRNESYYFTLTSIGTSTATINVTPVGCWNSFPSDPTPAVRCMIAVVPIPPQTLSVGQSYSSGTNVITLTAVASGTATFSVK